MGSFSKGKKWIRKMCKGVCNTEEVPRDWKIHLIVHICKKKEHTNFDNYICLWSTVFKLYRRIIEKKFRNIMKNHSKKNRWPLENLMERNIQKGDKLYLLFYWPQNSFWCIWQGNNLEYTERRQYPRKINLINKISIQSTNQKQKIGAFYNKYRYQTRK